ncbi:class F sortase [Clavibacter michiganensis]|uniref:Sortase n=2 Tax=Clavibacter michiganensis TaxID=28447 RepID=A5CM64_CLAM3|nr:class F sortase [Clavibacter michiganensis]MDO4019784.1 class F sortase [Clavibacter michiganensis]MDO4039689.1 class F sortase [Clavibacter michiganensis]MDO4042740.1 class F sortase [Clavibacter michiganensis]MDO4051863.1 class F sortase [Clavibacter michiganensis]MDO4060893.1 class F sortase [Clavibacter michiganensis]
MHHGPADASPARRARRAAVLAGALIPLAVLAGCAPADPGPAPAAPPAAATAAPSAPPTTAPSDPPTSAPTVVQGLGAVPTRVAIPAIDLDQPLIDLGIAADGRMEVPVDFDDVGWFTGGGRPGGRGPTVIAAHVDSRVGPAAFGRLAELGVGDEVSVQDVDGGSTRYVVTEVADFPKADFPTARVFGAQATDQLRLITCGGIFDRSVGHYEDNRVVFAEPVG